MIVSILNDIFLGLITSIQGFLLSLNNEFLLNNQKRSILALLGSSLIVYLAILIAFIPVKLFFYLFTSIFTISLESLEYFGTVTSAHNLFVNILWFIPLFAVYIINNLLSYETFFFSVLAQLNPHFAETLHARPRQSFISNFLSFVTRTCRLLLFVLIIYFLRLLPFIGHFIPSLWLLNSIKFLFNQTNKNSIKIGILAILLFISYNPTLQVYAINLLHIQLAANALARELFDTYLARITKHDKSDNPNYNHDLQPIRTVPMPKTIKFFGFSVPKLLNPLMIFSGNSNVENIEYLPHSSSSQFLRENNFILLGFALPFVLLFSIPLLGFCCVGMAHGSSAYCLIKIIKRQQEKYKNESGQKLNSEVLEENKRD